VSRAMRLLAILILLVTACSRGGEPSPLTGSQKNEVNLPPQVLGLAVQPENIDENIKDVDNPYVDSFGLFSFREGPILRATLQIGALSRSAQFRDDSFKRRIIGLIGAAAAKKVPVSETDVYITAGPDETRYAWFEGRGFFLLTVHKSYPFPRTLVRRLIGVEGKL
jgi:hypothetical protein